MKKSFQSTALDTSNAAFRPMKTITDEDETSSLGSNDSLLRNNLVQYFNDPDTPSHGRRKHVNLKRFASNQQLNIDFERKLMQPDARIGLLSRGKSSLFRQSTMREQPNQHSRRLSWMSASTLDLSQPLLEVLDLDETIGEKFKVLLKPPKFDRDDLLFSIHTFMSAIIDFIPGVKLDKSYQIFKDIRSLLRSPECIRLYGLLIHYSYWNILHPTARHSMQEVRFTHQRRRSFADVDFSQPLNVISTQNRIGLLPEILETDETQNHHFTYDDENISPVHRSYSFMVMNNANNNGGIISPSMLKRGSSVTFPTSDHDLARNTLTSTITFASSMGMASKDSNPDDAEAKTMEEIDDIFNQQLEKADQEDTLENASLGTDTSRKYISIQGEQITNIPFTSSRPDLMITTDTNTAESQPTYPWLSTEGSVSGASLSSETSLTLYEREQLFIQLETCITSLFKKMGRGKFALITGRQALISCCHYIVDDILTAMYPWFAQVLEDNKPKSPKRKSAFASTSEDVDRSPLEKSLKKLNLRLRRLVHQSISDLIDPSRIYTSSMLLNLVLGLGTSKSIKEATRKAKELLESETGGGRRGKYYRTSSAVLALFGDSKSPLARKFLQRSATLYSNIPGAVEPFVSKLDNVGEWDEPLEYFNSIKEKEMQEELQKIKEKITEKDVEKAELKRITERIIQGRSPGGGGRRSKSNSPTRSPDRSAMPWNDAIAEALQAINSRPTSQKSRATSNERVHRGIEGEHKESVRKPLDFMNLFKNQPDAEFYPRPNEATNNTLTSPHYRTRSRSASPENAAPFSPSRKSPSPYRPYPLGKLSLSSPNERQGRDRERNSSPSADKRFVHRKSKKNLHKIRSSLFFGDTSSNAQRKGTETRRSFQVSRPLNRTLSNSGMGYLPTEESLTLQSATVAESDSGVSLVNNEYAEIPISLNAKSALMNLMVDKTTKLYQSKIPTRQTAQRIALLKGEDLDYKTIHRHLTNHGANK